MKFREMTFEDLAFVEEHSLYKENADKEHPERIDFDFVLEHDNYILAAGGFRIINKTTAWAWIELTEYIKKEHLITTYRTIKEWHEIWCKIKKIYRLQAWVRSGFEEGKRLAEHLGFEKEFKMKDFLGPEKDAWMYVKIMPENV